MYVERALQPLVYEALSDTPVVLINGPRQSGKSTLVSQLAAAERTLLTFDDEATLQSAREDPTGFVNRLPELVALDEVQRVPELFRAIKLSVDRDRRPGRFLLTGSANIFTLPKLADSLAGRMEVLPLYPFAEVELRASQSSFLQDALRGKVAEYDAEYLGDALIDLVVRGGFPEAIQRTGMRRRLAWFNNYLDAIVQRDLQDIADIRQLDQVPALLALLAARTASLLNVHEISNTSRLSASSISRYLALLENVFMIFRVKPWSSNRQGQLTRQPKLHLVDTGLACALSGYSEQSLRDNRNLLGGLLESFIFAEIRKQASWQPDRLDVLHFRDKKKNEVDVVVRNRRGNLIGVEVKAAASVSAKDFRGLKVLARDAGGKFKCGIVFYDGERTQPFGDKFFAVPFAALWGSA